MESGLEEGTQKETRESEPKIAHKRKGQLFLTVVARRKMHRSRVHQKPDRNSQSPLLFNIIYGVFSRTIRERIKKNTSEK